MKFTPLSILGLSTHAAAYLATTTRYYDGQEGACGCGTSSGNFAWQLGISTGVYTAAGSQALFDTAGASWCGAGCGKCYNLTSTGSSPAGSSSEGGAAGDSIIVMVTNLCPYDGNAVWCPPVGGTNEYGYSYHFDIMAQEIIFGDNVIVDFKPVACPGQATSDWDTCVCYDNVALQTDVTPADLTTGGSVPPTSSTSTSSSSTTSTKASTTSTTSTTASSSTINTKASTTSTTSKTAISTSTGSSGRTGTQTLYGQCGGIGWPTSSPTACAAPAACTELNPYYYQCLG